MYGINGMEEVMDIRHESDEDMMEEMDARGNGLKT